MLWANVDIYVRRPEYLAPRSQSPNLRYYSAPEGLSIPRKNNRYGLILAKRHRPSAQSPRFLCPGALTTNLSSSSIQTNPLSGHFLLCSASQRRNWALQESSAWASAPTRHHFTTFQRIGQTSSVSCSSSIRQMFQRSICSPSTVEWVLRAKPAHLHSQGRHHLAGGGRC